MRDIGDVRLAMEGAFLISAGSSSETIAAPRLRFWQRPVPVAAAVLGALAVGAVTGAFRNLAPTVEPGVVTRTEIVLPGNNRLALADLAPARVGRPSLALSPDGTRLAYVVAGDGASQLVFRQMDQFESLPLPGTEGAFHPFFSPDGEWVGFFTPTELKKVSVRGGTPITLCPVRYALGASWGSDGTIVFSDQEGKRLARVSADGGEPAAVPGGGPLADGAWFTFPELLPDERGLLVTIISGISPRVVFISSETGEHRTLVERGRGAHYVPTGHLIYAGEGGVVAQRFDVATLQLGGSPVPVLDGVRIEAYAGAMQWTFSANGLLAYVPGVDAGISTPVWVTRDGVEELVPLDPARYGWFDLSPDGSRLAIQIDGLTSDVWVYDFERGGEPTRFTSEGNNSSPLWLPDGSRVSFVSDTVGPGHSAPEGIFVKAVDGGAREWLWGDNANGRDVLPAGWSSEGVFTLGLVSPDTGSDIWVLPEGSDEAEPFLIAPFDQYGLTFSPDGRWAAYMSDHTGQHEVYVKRYPPTDEAWQLTTDFGKEPVWSHGGDEIFYNRGGEIFSVAVNTDSESGLDFEPPQPLFAGPYVTVGGPEFDVAPDGRFLLLKEQEQPPPTQIQIVQNWHEELKRLVPVD